jgi:hypothetical protein
MILLHGPSRLFVSCVLGAIYLKLVISRELKVDENGFYGIGTRIEQQKVTFNFQYEDERNRLPNEENVAEKEHYFR